MNRVNRWSACAAAGLLGMAFALAPAGGAAPAARPATKPTAVPTTRPAGPRPVKVEPNKPFAHAASGFVFPANVGAFRRATVHTFDDAGNNVAVGYADPSLKIILTAYVYPHAGFAADAHFRQTKADVLRANPAAKLLDEGPATAGPDGRQYPGLRARYGFVGRLAGVEQDVVSEAYLFACGGQFLKYRAMYPAADAKAAAGRVAYFLETFAPPDPPATRPAEK